jgi:hypothetical protein
MVRLPGRHEKTGWRSWLVGGCIVFSSFFLLRFSQPRKMKEVFLVESNNSTYWKFP